MAEQWLKRLSSPDVRRFLEENENLDEKAFLLGRQIDLGVPAKILAEQIRGRRKLKEKLPLWYRTPGIIYFPYTSLEQCSSETTAQYKLERIGHFLNKKSCLRAADITGGYGADAYYISTLFASLDYAEPDVSLLEIARHNHHQLGATNISYHHSTAEKFLVDHTGSFDLIFADPSRKSEYRRKTVRLQDGHPDMIPLQHQIYNRTRLFMLKASPLLDIKEALRHLIYIAEVNVLAVNNEMRELLFVGLRGHDTAPLIRAINLSDKTREEFVFTFAEEQQATISLSVPQIFLYEPNRAILKAGAFRLVGKRYGLNKLHANTHLYTSTELAFDFPGRIFRITGEIAPNYRHTLLAFPERKANIIIRNYPATIESIGKKLKLHEGGTDYLIACTSVKKKHLLTAQRLK